MSQVNVGTDVVKRTHGGGNEFIKTTSAFQKPALALRSDDLI